MLWLARGVIGAINLFGAMDASISLFERIKRGLAATAVNAAVATAALAPPYLAYDYLAPDTMPKVRITKQPTAGESTNANGSNTAAVASNCDTPPLTDATRVYPALFLIKPEQSALLASILQECGEGRTQVIDRCREADAANAYLYDQRRKKVIRDEQKKAAAPVPW